MTKDELYEMISKVEDVKDDIDSIEVGEPVDLEPEEEEDFTDLPPEDAYVRRLVAREKRAVKRREAKRKAEESSRESMNKTTEYIAKAQGYVATLTLAVETLSNVASVVSNPKTIASLDVAGSRLASYIGKLVRVVTLMAERKLLEVERSVSESSAQMLRGMLSGKMSASLAGAYGSVIADAEALGEALDSLSGKIDGFIDMIPDNFKIGGEGMSFFLTPKHPTGGVPMPVANAHRSISNWLTDEISVQINTLMASPKAENAAKVAAKVGEAVEAANATGLVPSEYKFDLSDEASTKSTVRSGVNLLMRLCPSAHPMPKYEHLNAFTNIGFMIFLATGWCRAGQVAFGLPGYMPGVEPASVEASEG